MTHRLYWHGYRVERVLEYLTRSDGLPIAWITVQRGGSGIQVVPVATLVARLEEASPM